MTVDFDMYAVFVYSGSSYDALIQLSANGAFRGNITFYPPTAALPANTATGNTVKINYPSSRFSEILHLLQSEKPLHATVNPGNGIGFISTANQEPVGEQEGV